MVETMRGKPAGVGGCLVLAMSLAPLFLAGCEDVELNWGLQPQAQPRPAGRPAGRVVTQSDAASTRPVESSVATSPPARAPVGAPQPSAPTPAAAPAQLRIYQLVLLSEAGPATAPPGIKYIRLQHARAKDVANILMLLYLPSGPSGTENRYTLIYPTPLESELAAEAARQLDVGTEGPTPVSSGPGDSWRWGVAQAFAILDDPTASADRVRRTANALAVAINSAELPKLTRWVGGMVAGELLAHRLYDYAAAEIVHKQTEAAVEPGSYEQMALLYAQARALRQDGRTDSARQTFETILGQFTAMRGSEMFERVRRVLGSWDRRR